MEYRDSRYVLSTGKRFYASNGILGIACYDYDDATLYEGNDGKVGQSRKNKYGYSDEEVNDQPFTIAERQEIAHYMIGLWHQWIYKEQ